MKKDNEKLDILFGKFDQRLDNFDINALKVMIAATTILEHSGY